MTYNRDAYHNPTSHYGDQFCPRCSRWKDAHTGFSPGRNICRECRRSYPIKSEFKTIHITPALHATIADLSEKCSLMGDHHHVSMHDVIAEALRMTEIVIATWGIRAKDKQYLPRDDSERQFGDPLITPSDEALLTRLDNLTKSVPTTKRQRAAQGQSAAGISPFSEQGSGGTLWPMDEVLEDTPMEGNGEKE